MTQEAIGSECRVKNLDLVIKHLKDSDDGFYGQIVILIREGKAVRVE